jgi:hypothetical protein
MWATSFIIGLASQGFPALLVFTINVCLMSVLPPNFVTTKLNSRFPATAHNEHDSYFVTTFFCSSKQGSTGTHLWSLYYVNVVPSCNTPSYDLVVVVI